uniref:dUTPase-like domain-containing protein n=1 Tax=Pseudonaja textilis TaxID=8673 RepID=A0A670ZGB2_PSETE
MEALATHEQPLLAPPEEGLPPYHAVRFLPPTAPPDKSRGLSGTENTLSEDKSLPLRVQVDAVTAAIQEATNRGELSGDDLVEFGVEIQLNPVEIGVDAALNPQRVWKPLALRILKEIKQAAKEYGVRSPYTQALLEAVGYGNKMIPADWKALLKMILTPAQYLVLDQKWRQLAIQRGTANVTPDQLYGAGRDQIWSPATKGSAGIDLPLAEDLELGYPHVVCLGSTDFYGPLPPASVGLLLPRSSAHKRKLFVVPGVIDSDYEGQIKIQVHSPVPQSLKKGDCFAQLLVLPYLSLGESDRIRQGGFGSTDMFRTYSAYH